MSERVAAVWEGYQADDLARQWDAPGVMLYETLGSTNDVARRLTAQGAPVGTVVLADEQTAGRGRAGRRWASPPGAGLWFSVVGDASDEGRAGVLPLVVGLAVAGALDRFLTGVEVGVSWPNDLLVAGRKLGGILCEGSWEGPRRGGVVAGVGVNLLQGPEDFPAEVRQRAVSLRMAGGGGLRRADVARAVIGAVVAAVRSESALDIEALRRKDLLRGASISVTDPMTGVALVAGIAEGIAADGALLVRDVAGAVHVVRSGTVRPT